LIFAKISAEVHMLDESTSALLKCVNDGCEVGAYKIFTLEDFCLALDSPLEEKSVEEVLSRLQTDGYLFVKYSGGGMYCVGLSPLGADYFAEEKTEKEILPSKERETEAFFGGFLGGVTGGVISAAIALLMSLLFRR
jgi:hypothetical protein